MEEYLRQYMKWGIIGAVIGFMLSIILGAIALHCSIPLLEKCDDPISQCGIDAMHLCRFSGVPLIVLGYFPFLLIRDFLDILIYDWNLYIFLFELDALITGFIAGFLAGWIRNKLCHLRTRRIIPTF